MTNLDKWLLGKVVKQVLKTRRFTMFLKGYVTYISAALMIVTGILQMTGMAPDVIQTSVNGWDLILMGLGVFGIGRKIQTIANK